LNNNPRISPETVLKVNKAIKELNYHPSRSARGLVSRKTGNIGFILTEDHFLRSEPFYTSVFLGTEFEARRDEYYVLLTTISSDFKNSDPLPRFILEKNIDGLIIAGKVPPLFLKKISKYELPMTFVDYYQDSDSYPVVLVDNLAGGMEAVNHLISLGHKKISFIGADIDHPSIQDRFSGYKIAIERAALKFSEEFCITDEEYPNRESGYNAAKRLLEKNNGVTAVFAANDAMAIGAMQYFHEIKLKVPEDISIIGFDNVDIAKELVPPLTTIGISTIDMGIEVMRLISDLLKNKIKTAKKVLIPYELIVRKSTARLK
jgi:LacI family transcriptional regulator